MIACTAIEHEATLVTHDAALKDGAIGGLVVADWLDSARHVDEHVPQARDRIGARTSGRKLSVFSQ